MAHARRQGELGLQYHKGNDAEWFAVSFAAGRSCGRRCAVTNFHVANALFLDIR
jgi:hypothetical protein